jgi:hypothetical protein
MTTLEYLEKIDDTLSHWEDYFHGQEGTDVTEARANLDKVRKQLLIHSVSQRRELLIAFLKFHEADLNVDKYDIEDMVEKFESNQ